MDDHQRNDCGSVIVRCKMGCGLKFQRKLSDFHVNNSCPKRLCTCSMCGDISIWAEEFEEHTAKLCPNLPAECQLGCGMKGLNIKLELIHRINACPNRIIRCLCGVTMEFFRYDTHLVGDCENKLQLCSQGCGLRLPREDLPKHCQYECTH
jgi:hypothetical protein